MANFRNRTNNAGPGQLLNPLVMGHTVSFTIKSGVSSEFPTSNFKATLHSGNPDAKSEIILVASRAGDVFTGLTRGHEGTTDRLWGNDTLVAVFITEEDLGLLEGATNANETDIDNLRTGVTSHVNITATGTGNFGDDLTATKDVDGFIDIKAVNVNAGTMANARVRALNGTDPNDAVAMIVTGKSFTTIGGFKQDAGIIEAGINLSGGLSIMARHASGVVRFYAGGSADGDLALTINQDQRATFEGEVRILEGLISALSANNFLNLDNGTGNAIWGAGGSVTVQLDTDANSSNRTFTIRSNATTSGGGTLIARFGEDGLNTITGSLTIGEELTVDGNFITNGAQIQATSLVNSTTTGSVGPINIAGVHILDFDSIEVGGVILDGVSGAVEGQKLIIINSLGLDILTIEMTDWFSGADVALAGGEYVELLYLQGNWHQPVGF